MNLPTYYWPFLLEKWCIKPIFKTACLAIVCGVVRMRKVVVYGSASAARSTLEFEMFKHVFLTGPPGKKKKKISKCLGPASLNVKSCRYPSLPCQAFHATYRVRLLLLSIACAATCNLSKSNDSEQGLQTRVLFLLSALFLGASTVKHEKWPSRRYYRRSFSWKECIMQSWWLNN